MPRWQTKTEEARKTINEWIEEKTKNKINDIIPAGAIRQSDRLILTNTIYFKGTWVLPFKEENTKPAEFNVTDEKKVQVQMMFQSERYKYARLDGIQLLQMPYGLDETSIRIIDSMSENDAMMKLASDSYPEASKLTQEQLKKLPKLFMLIL